MTIGKNITMKKWGRGSNKYLGCWEEYQLVKRERGRKFWGRISSVGELYTTLPVGAAAPAEGSRTPGPAPSFRVIMKNCYS